MVENIQTMTKLIQGIDTLWVMIAAFMVFLMQAGFGMLEAGIIVVLGTVFLDIMHIDDPVGCSSRASDEWDLGNYSSWNFRA